MAALAGSYVFSDYCSGRIQSLRVVAGVTLALDAGAPAASVASFGQDAAGELYVLSLAGTVYRIDPALGQE